MPFPVHQFNPQHHSNPRQASNVLLRKNTELFTVTKEEELHAIPKSEQEKIIIDILQNYEISWSSSAESKNLLGKLKSNSSTDEKFNNLISYYTNKSNKNKALWNVINNNENFKLWNSSNFNTKVGVNFAKVMSGTVNIAVADPALFLGIIAFLAVLVGFTPFLPMWIRDAATRKPVSKARIQVTLNKLKKLNKEYPDAIAKINNKIYEIKDTQSFNSDASKKFMESQQYEKRNISEYLKSKRDDGDTAYKNNGKKLFLNLLRIIDEVYAEETESCPETK